MVYDVIIIGGGASGLFCSIYLPKDTKKCIIEKTDTLGKKILLSGGGRCNLTNINLDPALHYVGASLKSLPSLFHKFGAEDMMSYLEEHKIETKIEANGRVMLKSGKAKELLEFLVQQSTDNSTDHLLNHEVLSLDQDAEGLFVVTTSAGVYSAKQVIVATGGMTYPQIGASTFAYDIAKNLGISLSVTRVGLCGIETQNDFASLSGSTVQASLSLYKNKKKIYSNTGSLLFTHRGLSGPVIFDATVYIEGDVSQYSVQCDFDLKETSKKVLQYFSLRPRDTVRDISLTALRSLQEAKVSVGGILLQELDQTFQSKNISGLYFIGESLDITGKTGGYNLQRAWTSGYVCAKGIRI